MSKKLIGFIYILFILSSCVPEDQTDVFWDSIDTKNKYQSFIFVFSNTQIPTCADYGQPQLEKIWNGDIDDINSEEVNGCMMYPSILDPQYSNTAEELKFLFDQNGNNTFNTWPAYINNLTCFNTDSLMWYESIKTTQNKTPGIKLGIKSTPSDKETKIYVKGVYNTSISSHSIAVYAYRKSESINHNTSNGNESFLVKNRVVFALTPTVGKSLTSNSSGNEFREIFTFDTSNENISNLEIVAVVYKIENNSPTEVINSIRLEDL